MIWNLLILIAEKGKAGAVLSLKLRQRRTHSQMEKDARRAEEDKQIVADAKEIKKKYLCLEAENKRIKEEYFNKTGLQIMEIQQQHPPKK
jgi:hypothetical protein